MEETRISTEPLVALLLPQAEVAAPALAQLPLRPSDFPAHDPFRDVSSQLKHWQLQRHVFPAARPRTIISTPEDVDIPGVRTTLDEARNELTALWNETLSAPRRKDKEVLTSEPQLWIAVNRYFRREGPPPGAGFTLILCHANGFHKETWEPTLAHLLESDARDGIDEIWSLDAVNQGDSGILNRGKLSKCFDWLDHGRDLLQFTLRYLPPPSTLLRNAPTVLPPQPLSQDDLLPLDGAATSMDASPLVWRDRKIVLFGHSLGGVGSAIAFTSSPWLFHGIMMIDPVLAPPAFRRAAITAKMAEGALVRRDTWPDRAEARTSFLKRTAFFGKWDAAVLDRYIAFGLVDFSVDAPSQSRIVTLKCARRQEAAVFVDPVRRSVQAYLRLQALSPDITPPSGIAFADVGQGVIPEEYIDVFKKEVTCLRTACRIQGSGHLVVQERPRELAKELERFLSLIPRTQSPRPKLAGNRANVLTGKL